MKKEEAEKVKQLHTQWHKDYFDEKIDAMVDPELYVPRLWDVLLCKRGEYGNNAPKEGKEYSVVAFHNGKVVINNVNRTLMGDHKDGWIIYISDDNYKFLRHGTEPVRPPQKVKEGESFLWDNVRILRCERAEWEADHWVYVANDNTGYWDDDITPIIHLQSADEDRPFEVQDWVEWDRDNKIMHGIIVEMFPDGARIYNTDTGHPEGLGLGELRFAKRRER